MSRTPAKPRPHRALYERSDMPASGAALALAGVFGLIAMAIGLVGLLLHMAGSAAPPTLSVMEQARIVPPAPRLEVIGGTDRARTEARAQARLEGYHWVDRQAGVARIPIARAMALTAARGWREPPPAEAPP